MNSSMPKLSSARLVPNRAIARPGGTYQYHSPESGALFAWAQYIIVPQFHVAVLVSPRYASETKAPME